MWRKLAIPTGTLAGVPFIVSTVHAAEEKPEVRADQSAKKTCKAKNLPLYGEPACATVEIVTLPVTPIEANIAVVRRGVWGIMDSFQSTTDWCSDKYEVSKAHTNDLITYIQEDPGALPRAAIITVSGLGGVVAGYKGGFFRKFFFASAGMLTASAVCYPPQAVDITRSGWQRVYNEAKQMWETKPKTESPKAKPVSEKIAEEVNKNLDKLKDPGPAKKEEKVDSKTDEKKKANKKDDKAPAKEAKKDYGMSKSEDKDLYTTRGK